MTQHLLSPSVSFMSPPAAEVWANCKCYLYFKGPFALWQETKVPVYLRQWLVSLSRKTSRTPNVTGWGVSEGKASCLRVKHPALDIHLAKGSRVYQLHSDSSPGCCPAPLQEAWKAAPQPEVQVAAGSREHHPARHRRCLTCSLQVRRRWAQLLLGRHELARRGKPISAGLWH